MDGVLYYYLHTILLLRGHRMDAVLLFAHYTLSLRGHVDKCAILQCYMVVLTHYRKPLCVSKCEMDSYIVLKPVVKYYLVQLRNT